MLPTAAEQLDELAARNITCSDDVPYTEQGLLGLAMARQQKDLTQVFLDAWADLESDYMRQYIENDPREEPHKACGMRLALGESLFDQFRAQIDDELRSRDRGDFNPSDDERAESVYLNRSNDVLHVSITY